MTPDRRRLEPSEAPVTHPTATSEQPEEEEEEQVRAPWHFKLLLVGTVLYLIYRFIWFIFWLTGHAWHG